MSEIHLISLDKIKNDTAIQCRVSMDEDNIADIMGGLDDTPPIRLYREELPGAVCFHIGDGWHRKIAHERAGRLIIRAYVLDGGVEAALLYAVKANGAEEHGIKRTQADKQKAITVYLTYKDWWQRSDPWVAKDCKVDHKTVAKARGALELAGTIPTSPQRLGLDGKTQIAQKQVGNSQPESEAKPRILPPEEKQPSLFTGVTIPPPSLLIKGRLGGSGQDLFDDAVAAVRAKQEQTSQASAVVPPIEYVEYGAGEMLATESEPSPAQSEPAPSPHASTQAEVAASVEAAFAKAGQLDPKTLLPVATKSAAASTPTNGEGYQHYNTPASMVALIRRFGAIGLDPCSNKHSVVKAWVEIEECNDGLSLSWVDHSRGKGLVYVNPPYNDVPTWAEKAIEEAKLGAEVILLVPSNHSTRWYDLLRGACQAFAQLNFKVIFGKEGVYKSSAFHESTLFYFGDGIERFTAVFEETNRDNQKAYAWVRPCAPYARPSPIDPVPQAPSLPLEAAPQSEAKPTPPKEEALLSSSLLTRCKHCGVISQDVPQCPCKAEKKAERDGLFAGIFEPPTDRMGTCARCGALCHPLRPCACAGEAKEVEPPPRLHAALKACAKGYQSEGYEVTISTPRSNKKKSVMGAIGSLADRHCCRREARRDEQEDVYTVAFCEDLSFHDRPVGKEICTLHAVKKEAPIKGTIKEKCPHCEEMRHPGADMELHQMVHPAKPKKEEKKARRP